MSSPIEFDPMRVPLHGIHLVEASAGTGKTYCIGSVLLRALGRGELTIEQIVVVTFTDAATRELRQRLRERLEQALLALEPGAAVADPLLAALMASAPRADLRRRWAAALARLDEAVIATIHGFCQRIAAEYAFERGEALAEATVEKADALREQAVRDLWRAWMDDAERAAGLLELARSAAALLQLLKPALELPAAQVDGEIGDAAPAADEDAVLRAGRALQADGAFAALFGELRALKPRYDGNRLRSAHIDQAEACIAELLNSAEPWQIDCSALDKLSAAQLDAATRKGPHPDWPPQSAALRWLQEWPEAAARRQRQAAQRWRMTALREVRAREQALRQQTRRFAFNDLIERVYAALCIDAAGATLALQLARRFRFAVLDEFQDTDGRQYAIFRRIYQGRADAGLLLVGDPKQAIYRFRGGDVFAYRQARDDAAGRYSLSCNRRSQATLVAAVNALFGAHPSPFLFDFIAFNSAQAANPPLPDAAVTIWRLNGQAAGVDKLGAGAAEALCLEATANEIGRLLAEPNGAAGSIAVLVRKHQQAQQLRSMLVARGIASAYGGAGSVYASAAADAIFDLLAAWATPRDPGRQRRVLAGDLFELPAAALNDEPAVAAPLAAIVEARERCLRGGPAAALLPLITQAAALRLREVDGERWLSDALQLGECLQSLWQEGRSLNHLLLEALRARSAALEASNEIDEAQRPRLEAEQARVQLMTVHRSKGLQFDIVFAPLLWQGEAGRATAGSAVLYHAADGSLRLDPGGPDWPQHAAEAARECFAEGLRLAYVALTRARQRVYLGWGDVGNQKDPARGSCASPLAWLLHHAPPRLDDGRFVASRDAAPFGAAAIAQALHAWQRRCGEPAAIKICDLPTAPPAAITPAPPVEPTLLTPAEFTRHPLPRRHIASFSALFAAGPGQGERPDHDESSAVFDEYADIGGARFGEYAHAVLERIDFRRWTEPTVRALALQLAERHGYGRREATFLEARIDALLNTPLIDGLRLDRLEPGAQVNELEFFFPLEAAALPALAGVLANYPRFAREPGALGFDSLHGYMRGFVDLVLRWQDRYYLIDYKTNRLGADLDAYTPARLASAVRAADYDLQYLIYALALHRLLRARLGERYRPARDFGGVCYVFLRGLNGDGVHGVFVDRIEAELLEVLDRWAAGASLAQPAAAREVLA